MDIGLFLSQESRLIWACLGLFLTIRTLLPIVCMYKGIWVHWVPKFDKPRPSACSRSFTFKFILVSNRGRLKWALLEFDKERMRKKDENSHWEVIQGQMKVHTGTHLINVLKLLSIIVHFEPDSRRQFVSESIQPWSSFDWRF